MEPAPGGLLSVSNTLLTEHPRLFTRRGTHRAAAQGYPVELSVEVARKKKKKEKRKKEKKENRKE